MADEPLTLWHMDLPWLDPFVASQAFADIAVVALFESGGPPDGQARASYLCVDPFLVIAVADDVVRVDGEAVSGSPLNVLAEWLARYRMEPDPDPASFAFRGGAAGYIGYEIGSRMEQVAAAEPDADAPPDLFMAFYDVVIGFDHPRRRCRIHASGLPRTGTAGRRQRARMRLDWVSNRLSAISIDNVPPAPMPPLRWEPDWDEIAHAARIRPTLAYIQAGDIFQANITTRQVALRAVGLRSEDVYAALRHANPAPFSAWLRCNAHAICCSSPERFLSLDPYRNIETQPIKGTVARSADPNHDAAAAARLAASAKDRAEHIMIVDVLRHDLGRVAQTGSVAVPSLCKVQSFATVHHLVSQITARLAFGLGPIDLLRATLPGGSITGAPKVRAMQIIAELESSRRGPYCGSALWIGFDAAMDSNIIIRSVVLTPDRLIVQAGGGVVADSTPEAEFAEMLLKLAPMLSIFDAAT